VRISTDVENIGKFQKEVKELKNTIFKLKHTLQGFNNKLDEEEERTNQLADKAEELPTKSTKKKKIMKLPVKF